MSWFKEAEKATERYERYVETDGKTFSIKMKEY